MIWGAVTIWAVGAAILFAEMIYLDVAEESPLIGVLDRVFAACLIVLWPVALVAYLIWVAFVAWPRRAGRPRRPPFVFALLAAAVPSIASAQVYCPPTYSRAITSYSVSPAYTPPANYSAPAYVSTKAAEYTPPKYEDAFDAAIAEAIKQRAYADSKIDELAARTAKQVQVLRALTGNRGIVSGYLPTKGAVDISGLSPPPNAYAGDTAYGDLRTYSRVADFFGDRGAALSDYASTTRAVGDAAAKAAGLHAELLANETDAQSRVAETLAKGESADRVARSFGEAFERFLRASEPQARSRVVEHATERSTIQRGLVATHCGACHSAAKASGGVSLEGAVGDDAIDRAIAAVVGGKMPPKKRLASPVKTAIVRELATYGG